MKLGTLVLSLGLCLNSVLFAQPTKQQSAPKADYELTWRKNVKQAINENESIELLNFDRVTYLDDGTPVYVIQKTIKNNQSFNVSLSNEHWQPLDGNAATNRLNIGNQFKLESAEGYQRGQKMATIVVTPIRKNASGGFEQLTSFDLNFETFSSNQPNKRSNRSFAVSSIMATGEWYKIGVTTTGLYKVDKNLLSSILGSSNDIASSDIHLYGNSAGLLPTHNSIYRPDDLLENAIKMNDGGDGVFDDNDYFVFYAKGSDNREVGQNGFYHVNNMYSDTSYYFINIESGKTPKRIQTQNSDPGVPTHQITKFNDYQYIERDEINLIKSGSEWYGDEFDVETTKNYSFNFPNVTGDSILVEGQVLAAHCYLNSTYNIIDAANGQNRIVTVDDSGCDQYDPPAEAQNFSMAYTTSSDQINLQFNYNKPDATAKGWLNYIRVNAQRELSMSSSQMSFRVFSNLNPGNLFEYSVQGANSIDEIWETTDPSNCASVQFNVNGTAAEFSANADSLREFIAFNNNGFYVPTYIKEVPNQNLHALSTVDYLMVCPIEFKSEADRLADFHRSRGLSVHVVTTDQVFNEFSSGMVDATAIKDFTRMFYERANGNPSKMPKYLLLFGDGSYDNKHRLTTNEAFIPTFQSTESLYSTASYTSDDYFAILDQSEGMGNNDLIDIGVGRFPVSTLSEATAVVDKTIHYMTNTSSADGSSCDFSEGAATLGDWRNIISFVADDEDGGAYVTATEGAIVNQLNANHNEFNLDKIYIDAFVQESTPGGERFYAVEDKIQQRVQQGCLIINYMGHGGEAGWAHERILDVPTINAWTNYNQLPLFVTATCEFSRFDDPGRTSAGELVLLNKNGGGCALVTTTRLVYSSGNTAVNRAFFENIFLEPAGTTQPLGDVLIAVKNTSTVVSGGNNHRKFGVLGDPALVLAVPGHNIVTDSINGIHISTTDTLGALSRVTVKGHIQDNPAGTVKSDFNGYIFPTVFDKSTQLTTLANNASSGTHTFNSRRNVIYKGKASVQNGYFQFTFVVPKDIAYQIGPGRISYYAHNGTIDAHGFTESFMIGGTGSGITADNEGPQIELFMNNEQFVNGGMTDETPKLLAKVFDENGINTVGNGIGHDISAVIDDNTSNAIILNEYYESDLDTYQSGRINYNLSALEEGEHTLTLKVWDVHNNSSEEKLDFVVAQSGEMALDHVLNYPNPFTTNTTFFFEHNQVCQTLDVQLQIYTVSGKLVKTFDETVFTDGYRIEGISWDGRDEFGDQIGRGVYIYNLSVRAPDGALAKKTEKLVILK